QLVHNAAGHILRFENSDFTLRIYPGDLAEGTIYCPISARKTTTAAEAIDRVIQRLQLDRTRCYVLAEVKEFGGEEWILNPTDCPVQRMMLWPRVALEHRPMYGGEDYRFLLRQKNLDGSIHYGGSLQMWLQVTEERRRLMERGLLPQPDSQGDHADLCCLPELNERSLLDNLRSRFYQEKIYTYVGSILIGINPFKFLPIYNPKYVKMYDNHTLGDLEPHIYAVADVAYHAMLQRQRNQCIVISGESGSGKTQSTNFLIHHLTALSQKGFASGVEQIILGAGPVLEAFGNAKTAQNNNSSRFGKFIQVNYQESGTVRGAYVEKYLLEKSRLVYQEHNERNYHVFYYLLAGVSDEERKAFHLKKPEEYHYLSQMTKTPRHQHWDSYYDGEPDCFTVEGEDLKHDFERLQLAMEMVGFLPATRKLIFSLLSAILHLGNIRYKRKNRDDSIDICNPEVLPVVSELLEVKEEMLFEALTTRKTVTVGERLIVPYKLSEAGTVRDSMAKSLYSALFDWIVFRINHALLNNRDLEETTKILSIGVLDIFGFEDYESNSFEQFCINFANERLQHYFNQHIFKLEQEEYAAEGISWKNIDYIDNTGCINLISKKPTALFHLLDEECNFPQATNQTLLDKFRRQHEGNRYIEFSAVMEPAFIIKHYAGKVKYGVKDFREKNTDHMRPDIVALLKSSKNAFICSLIGIDPSATFRWAVLRAYFRALVAFKEAGKRHKPRMTGHDDSAPSAALKSLDSFSFLQHPVHQRSLEILQRCKEEKHSTNRKSPWMRQSDNQGINSTMENPFQGPGWKGRTGRQNCSGPNSSTAEEEEGLFLSSVSSKLLERAHDILMRNKNYKSKPNLPKHLLNVKSLKYLSKLTLHDRITKSLLHLHKKKKPPSISAQFQASLNKLMETLGQSEPYFVKCIRSNADKVLCRNPIFIERHLESIMNFSKHRLLSVLKDFVHHFHVLLPPGVSVARESIQECLGQLDLQPEGYQVGKTKVFLREAQRQQLQASLHREVLLRIVMLQRRFRARLERKQFVRMREAASCIQKWWRSHRPVEQEDYCDPVLQEGAALCLQTHWRGYRARQRFRRWRQAALVLQKLWRFQLERRCAAALVIQAAWRCHGARREYQDLREAVGKLQALSRGFLARRRFRELREQKLKQEEKLLELQNGRVSVPLEEWEQPDTTMGLDLSTWEDRTCEERERSLLSTNRDEEKRDGTEDGSSNARKLPLAPTPPTIHREKERTLDEGSHKTTRAKRENRRMRELEQAQFSLKLLKVRANSIGVSSSPEEQHCSMELVPPASPSLPSPQGTPDSQSSKGSFELLVMDEDPSKASEMAAERDEPGWPLPAVPDDLQENHSPTKMDLPPHPAKTESCLPTFYIPAREHSPPVISTTITSALKPLKDRRESARRPLVVVISMQKETPLSEGLGSPIHPRTHLQDSSALSENVGPSAPKPDSAPQGPAPEQEQVIMDKLLKLNEDREERQRNQQQQNEREMMEQIRQQKGVLERQRLSFVQHEREMFEKRREEALQRIQRSQEAEQSSASSKRRRDRRPVAEGWAPKLTLEFKDGGGSRMRTATNKPPTSHDATAGLTEKTGNIFFFPKDKVATLSKDTRNQIVDLQQAGKTESVGRSGPKKKARMARTRSDFLTRGASLSVDGDSDEDDSDVQSPLSPRHFTLPLSKQNSTESGLTESCFSDSDMLASSKEQKKLQKAMSSGDLVKVDSMRKNSPDERVRSKMRFWGKNKYGEKKNSREKLSFGESLEEDYGETGLLLGEEGQENLSCSPDLTLDRGFRDLKENKEPSPKVKRRRSVKISSVALEPTRWQNEALQILTCTNDYRSMNDFLMKKISDLDTEDSKKDTMVDVVFKKALKEFRLNIFNSYSTALAMDDGKSIRYKDLYALFEHILEKTMRQEQRDWRESPVKVWVNTFKIFLDEFMTEYKPLDSKTSAPKPERKKRRKKDADTVEEHNGHIFKSTQYSIPTFCEYCSSLIWMMDRASVCKLCRYACHRKCCQKTTVKCSKMFDPELSSRQFGVDISHLTNEEKTVPLVVEKLINYIEMHGIYTEGIYRKPGSANKIKELRLGLDNDVDGINLDDYNIHVIASVFKQWLRDLPNPLMTFELYEEFVRAMGSQDKKEIIRGVYSIIDQLSRTHLNTLERLIFHLVRIALQEDTNRMSANALAIVFAPCILRCPDTIDPLQSVQDISKTTACVEYIICEQMNKYKVRLKDISTLEFAESKAKNKLTLIRRSMGKGRVPGLSYHAPSPPVSPRLQSASEPAREESGGEESAEATIISEHQQVAMQHEERVLAEQIENLQKEKEELTFEMLSLEPRASDDETLDSEASIGTGDSSENLNVDSEETISDFSERGPALTSPWPRRSDGRSHRGHAHRRQLDCREAAESCSTVSSFSTLSHFHPSSSSSSSAAASRSSPPRKPEVDEKPQFTSRGTYNPEKGKQKLRGARHSVTRHSRQGPGRDPSTDVPQHMVLYGSNEFMV
uniref:Myosin IXAa n=1 Tax=Oryzias latipes TaxID=8090 RepID=A0A3P9LL37_ORYLA